MVDIPRGCWLVRTLPVRSHHGREGTAAPGVPAVTGHWSTAAQPGLSLAPIALKISKPKAEEKPVGFVTSWALTGPGIGTRSPHAGVEFTVSWGRWIEDAYHAAATRSLNTRRHSKMFSCCKYLNVSSQLSCESLTFKGTRHAVTSSHQASRELSSILG